MATEGLNNSDILKALGLKLPNTQANPLRDLWNRIRDQKEFTTFSQDVNNLSSFADFETYLQDELGFTAEEAETFRLQMEQKYTDFADFQDSLSSFGEFEEWENSISWGETVGGNTTDEDGRIVNGIRFHDSTGLTRDNVSVPAGSVELFGNEVHFSRTGSSRSSDDTTSDTGTNSLFSWTGMSASPSSPDTGQEVTFSAEVTNNGDYQESYIASLKIDGVVEQESSLVSIGPGGSREFTFTQSFDEAGDYSAQINESSTIEITVLPPGIV